MRRAALARAGYRCEVSRRFGKNVPANTVHHIFPVSDYPQYKWEPWNLAAVSSEVHDKLHNRNGGELTEMGEELLRRTARKRGIEL